MSDKKLLAQIRANPCLACGKTPCGEVHHVTTVKAGGKDEARNCMSLCHRHHMEWHTGGPGKMIKKYPSVGYWLARMGRTDIFDRIERARKK